VARIVRWLDRRRLVRPDARIRSRQRFSPYLLGGVGMQRDDYEGLQGDDNVTLALGMGAMWDLYRSGDGSRTVQLRPEVRTRWDMQSGNTLNDVLAQVGLSFGFGPATSRRRLQWWPRRRRRRPRRRRSSAAMVTTTVSATRTTSAPARLPGIKVDSVGCPLEQRLKLLFDFDSAELSPSR
jgi:hypothetical protein